MKTKSITKGETAENKICVNTNVSCSPFGDGNKRYVVGYQSPIYACMAQFDKKEIAEGFARSDFFKAQKYILNYIYDRKEKKHINSARFKWSKKSDLYELKINIAVN